MGRISKLKWDDMNVLNLDFAFNRLVKLKYYLKITLSNSFAKKIFVFRNSILDLFVFCLCYGVFVLLNGVFLFAKIHSPQNVAKM